MEIWNFQFFASFVRNIKRVHFHTKDSKLKTQAFLIDTLLFVLLSSPASFNTLSFDFLSTHDVLLVFLQHRISVVSERSLSVFFFFLRSRFCTRTTTHCTRTYVNKFFPSFDVETFLLLNRLYLLLRECLANYSYFDVGGGILLSYVIALPE